MHKIIHTSPIWSNAAYAIAALLIGEYIIMAALLGLAFTSVMFHFYEYEFGNPINNNPAWHLHGGRWWQKADVIMIYVTFCVVSAALLDQPVIGLLIGAAMGYVEPHLNKHAIGIIAAYTVMIAASHDLIIAICGAALLATGLALRTEAYINPIRHSLWHVFTAAGIWFIATV